MLLCFQPLRLLTSWLPSFLEPHVPFRPPGHGTSTVPRTRAAADSPALSLTGVWMSAPLGPLSVLSKAEEVGREDIPFQLTSGPPDEREKAFVIRTVPQRFTSATSL